MASGDGKAGWDRDSSSGTACVWTEDDKGAGGKKILKKIQGYGSLLHRMKAYAGRSLPGDDELVPDSFRVGRVGHVRPRCLLHDLLVVLIFGKGDGSQGTDAQRRRNGNL